MAIHFLRLLAATALLLTSSALFGQADRSSLIGRVTDGSGGIVAGADVQVKRISTNEVFRTQTTSTGDFTLGSLPADSYQVRVTRSGFSAVEVTGIRLEVGQARRVDAQLQVGDIAQRIDVRAEALLLNTDTPTPGSVIDNSKIAGLPLNSRDVVGGLTLLTAGAAPLRQSADSRGSNYTVRGQRYTDNMATVDGSSLSFGNGGLIMSVNPDAVQEFGVKTGLYGAEYGIKPGAQFTIITKSGTNTPHGTLFEYLRNDKLDARNFFAAQKQPYKRNQFGGVFGAPVYIPKLLNGKDRLWFFFAYSGEKIRQFQPLTGTVPTDAERNGRFASTIIDPLAGQAFPGNTIPANRLNPVAQKLLSLWPSANTAGRGFNFTSANSVLAQDNHQVILKLDARVSDTDHWSGRLMRNVSPLVSVNAISAFGRQDFQGSWDASITNTRTFRSRIVNDVTVSMIRLVQSRGATDAFTGFSASLGIPNFPLKSPDFRGVPTFTIAGYLPLGEQIQNGQVSYGDWSARENISFVSGAHSFKAGYQFRRNHIWPMLDNRSTFSFTSRYTQNAFADLLLGYLTSATQSTSVQRGRVGENNHYLYFQDDWKVSSKLTMNLGVRYEYLGDWTDRRGFLANFNPATGSLFPALQNQTLQPGQEGRYVADYPLVTYRNKGLQPRVGISYRLTSKTVIHSGFGIYGNDLAIGMPQNMGSNPRPNSATKTFLGDAKNPNVTLSNPFNESALGVSALPSLNFLQPDMPQMNVYTWGLSVERQLAANTAFKAGYQGSHTAHDYVLMQINDAVPGPGPLQQRRPYPQFQGISGIVAAGDNRHNGMTLELEQRPGPAGFSMKVAYTWAKTLDTVGGRLAVPGDPGGISSNLSLRTNRGRSEADVPSLLVAMVGYELPFGKGKPLLSRGLAGHVLGGWSFFSLLTLNSGSYITPVMSVDRLDVGSLTSSRPDVLRSPNLDDGAHTPQHWFDTAAFVTPAGLRYGNAGRSIIKAPGVMNVDLSVLRDFQLTERLKLQFRFESFNLMNHANFGLPGTTFGTSTFGVIGSALDPRDLQFGLKIYF